MSRKTHTLSCKSLFTLKFPGLIIRNLMFCELQFRNDGKNGLFPPPPPHFLNQCSQVCFPVVNNIAFMPTLSHRESSNLQGTSGSLTA